MLLKERLLIIFVDSFIWEEIEHLSEDNCKRYFDQIENIQPDSVSAQYPNLWRHIPIYGTDSPPLSDQPKLHSMKVRL